MAGQPGRFRAPDNRKRTMSDWRRDLLAAGCLAAVIAFGLAFPPGAGAQALSQTQLQALNDKLSTEFGYYLGAEEERHADGKSYIDLGQRFEYMPSGGGGGGGGGPAPGGGG